MDAFKNLHLKISKFRKPGIEKDKSAKFLCYCMIIYKRENGADSVRIKSKQLEA